MNCANVVFFAQYRIQSAGKTTLTAWRVFWKGKAEDGASVTFFYAKQPDKKCWQVNVNRQINRQSVANCLPALAALLAML